MSSDSRSPRPNARWAGLYLTIFVLVAAVARLFEEVANALVAAATVTAGVAAVVAAVTRSTRPEDSDP